ncbi:Transglycosylase SLT domain-containing protein [Rhizobium sp. NFR07]|uniref:lytic transglycosylase domain-containing protein n=1 Tax=Rhizobium sp. NFR07 TaxID=1566262 RepID=UPI0008E2537C|nr:Transglycosylase SLT domain-containing protein [Rhizobium sp. NFR07]
MRYPERPPVQTLRLIPVTGAIALAACAMLICPTAMGQTILAEVETLGIERECGPSPLTTDEIRAMVVETARRQDFDETFALAIAFVESRFGQSLNSPKGARGPMQLMPATALRFAVTDICDAAQNIDAGIRYLRQLENEFHNPLLVAAAYNCGEARVRDHRGIPPIHETLNYVASVINQQIKLGFNSAPRAPGQPATSDGRRQHTAGVIKANKTRTFVGGVMHF